MRMKHWILGAAMVILPTLAIAEAPEAEASRLLRTRMAERYRVNLGNASQTAGAARIAVNAPIDVVRRIVTDYGHYQDVMPGFARSRVVAQSADGVDVYLQVPILHGAAKLWAVTRFSPLTRINAMEQVEARMVGPGNVDDLRARWRLTPVDEQHTILQLELLLVPKVPFPPALVVSQLEESSDDAVSACRTHAETLSRSTPAAP